MKWYWTPNQDVPLYPPDPEGRLPTLEFSPSRSVSDVVVGGVPHSVEDIILRHFWELPISLHGLRKHIPFSLYPKLWQYLDAIERTWDINVGIEGIPFLHFLVKVYYICTDSTEFLSTFHYIRDFIRALHNKIPSFDINIPDFQGNTPLMRVLWYQREVSENVKNGEAHNILRNLRGLEYMLEQLGGEVRLTREQWVRATEVSEEEVRLDAQNIQARNIIARLYTPSFAANDPYGDFSARV